MYIHKKFCVLKFPEIREKVFTINGSGNEQNLKKKTNIFSNSTSLKLSFALCNGILLPSVPKMLAV